jgi:uncharacterized membrane protein YqjE
MWSRAGAPASVTDLAMEPPLANVGQLVETSKRFARQLLTIGENRLELLMVEVQEERERMMHAILLALGAGVFGLLAGIVATGAIVVLLWELSRVAALLALTGLYGATAVCLYWRLKLLLRHWESLPATLDQLRKDRACLEKNLTQARSNGGSNC